MGNLIEPWLRLPAAPLADLERYGVSFQAGLKCGGVRAGQAGNWIVGAFADPPSCWHWVDEVVLDDLVVFHPERPDRFRTVYGSGVAMLGEGHFNRTRFRPLSNSTDQCHLRVFPTPLRWLQEAGGGVVPLDMPAFGRAMIGESVRLVAEDLQHGEQLDRTIRAAVRFAYPEIRVAA